MGNYFKKLKVSGEFTISPEEIGTLATKYLGFAPGDDVMKYLGYYGIVFKIVREDSSKLSLCLKEPNREYLQKDVGQSLFLESLAPYGEGVLIHETEDYGYSRYELIGGELCAAGPEQLSSALDEALQSLDKAGALALMGAKSPILRARLVKRMDVFHKEDS